MVPPSFATADAAASSPRYRADPSGSRATFSLSFRGGLSAGARLSGAAIGGVLLTVNAEARVYHRPPTGLRSLASAIEGDAQAAFGAILHLCPLPLERGDRRANVEAGGVRGPEDELARLAQAEGDTLDPVHAGQ